MVQSFIRDDRLTTILADNRLLWDTGGRDRRRQIIPTDGVEMMAPSVTKIETVVKYERSKTQRDERIVSGYDEPCAVDILKDHIWVSGWSKITAR